MIKRKLYILIISILMTSCATLMNRPYKYVTVLTTEPCKIICKQDTIYTVKNKAHLKLERNNESVSIVAITDSFTKSIDIESKNSFMYWSNIYFNYGIGMIIDGNNPKRYSYPQKIYINSADAVNKYDRHGKANNKGELYLHASLPFINSFRMMHENEGSKVSTGFWGFTIGLDFYHSKNQFINFGLSGTLNYSPFLPFIMHEESMISEYISLSNNHKIKRLSIGYGLSFAVNTFGKHKTWGIIPVSTTTTKKYNVFGLIFPTYFQIGEKLNLGIVYRPTFYRLNMIDKFVYEHLISVDLALKMRLKK